MVRQDAPVTLGTIDGQAAGPHLAKRPALPSWTRHPADLARLLASLAALAVALGLTEAEPELVTSISRDLLSLAGRLPDTVAVALVGLAQILAVLAPCVLVAVLLVRRAFRLLGVLLAGGAVAAALATSLQGWLDDTAPSKTLQMLDTDSWITGAAFPSPAFISGLAAVVTILVPSLPRRWQRAGWLGLVVAALLRLLTAVAVPLHIVTMILLGITVGSALLSVAGAPRRRVGADTLLGVLAAAGRPPRSLEPGTTPGTFAAVLADGTAARVQVFDRDDRDAELLFRVVSAAQRRGIEQDHPGWSPGRVVEHAALTTLLAQGAGVKVPEVLAVGVTPEDAGVLLFRDEPAVPLAELQSADLTDDVLRAAWRQVAALHEASISHGRLHLGHLALAADGSTVSPAVTITDLTRSQLSTGTERRLLDVAELLVSTAARVGVERAVAAALVVGREPLGAALPFLQPLALSPRTRRDLRATKGDHPELLDDLRQAVQEASHVAAYELAPIQRLSVGSVVGLAGSVVLGYVFLAFASNWSAISESLGEADWVHLPAILVLAGATYVAGALSLKGAVTNPLPLTETTEVMLGQSFLNRFTPANAGGMALRVRYLQRYGATLDVAAASIGLTSAASGVVQVLFLFVFLTWGRTGAGLGFELPDANVLAVVLLLVLAVAGGVWFTPLRRKLVDSRLAVSADRIFREVRTLAGDPGKVALLFGGAGLGKLVTIVAFTQSTRALGVDLPFAQLAALYLTANTVASAAPTPGGVGAVEAALVAVLTGVDVPTADALSAVLIFRLATYWLPVLPAYAALRHLRSRDVV